MNKLSMRAQERLLRESFGTDKYNKIRGDLIRAGQLNPYVEANKIRDGVTEGLRIKKSNGLFTRKIGLRYSPDFLHSLFNKKGKTKGTIFVPEGGMRLKGIPNKVLKTGGLAHEGFEALALSEANRLGSKKYIKASGSVARPFTGLMPSMQNFKRFGLPVSPGHYSPTVLLRESQMLPMLPTQAQKTFIKMREKRSLPGVPPQSQLFDRAGLKYGRTTRVNKKDVKRLWDIDRAEAIKAHAIEKDFAAKKRLEKKVLNNINLRRAFTGKLPFSNIESVTFGDQTWMGMKDRGVLATVAKVTSKLRKVTRV